MIACIILSYPRVTRKQRQNVFYFSSQEAFEEFHDWLVSTAKYPFMDFANALQDAMVALLRSKGDSAAADWFRDTMTGPVEVRVDISV